MAWNVIRQATPYDKELLEKRAESFAKRHGLQAWDWETWVEEVENAIEYHIDQDNNLYPNPGTGRYLRRLWKCVVARALRHPDATGIAWGNVGYRVSE